MVFVNNTQSNSTGALFSSSTPDPTTVPDPTPSSAQNTPSPAPNAAAPHLHSTSRPVPAGPALRSTRDSQSAPSYTHAPSTTTTAHPRNDSRAPENSASPPRNAHSPCSSPECPQNASPSARHTPRPCLQSCVSLEFRRRSRDPDGSSAQRASSTAPRTALSGKCLRPSESALAFHRQSVSPNTCRSK